MDKVQKEDENNYCTRKLSGLEITQSPKKTYYHSYQSQGHGRGHLNNAKRIEDSRAESSRPTNVASNFSSSRYRHKSSLQRGEPPKCSGQQGSISGSGKGSKWKPARFIASATMTEDEKTAELYKKVRGVLNKLTPQKFESLLDQVRSLPIDTTERLQGVIDLIYEDAVDAPNSPVAHAVLCRELALMQVPATDGRRKEGFEFVNFRKLLVIRCQLEFEKNSDDETERNRRTKEIEDCSDLEKKKDMQLELDEYECRLRVKSVGNIRFIGELFKQQMLTVNIMLRCCNDLLDTNDEESLECLCVLLTTVGKELQIKQVDLGGIFSALNEFAEKKHEHIGNRVRFLIQDVIDLRASWRGEKGGGDGSINSSTYKKRSRNVSNDNGCSTAPSRGSRTPFTIQSDKLKNKAPMMDEPLGSIQMFGNWGCDSNIKTQPPLQNIGTESDKRPALGVALLVSSPQEADEELQ